MDHELFRFLGEHRLWQRGKFPSSRLIAPPLRDHAGIFCGKLPGHVLRQNGAPLSWAPVDTESQLPVSLAS